MGWEKLLWETGKKVLKNKTKTVTIKPGTKFPGQKTVKEHKSDVSHKKYIDELKAVGAQLTGKINKSAKELQNLNKTIKDQQKILDK